MCPKASDYQPCACDKIIAGINPNTLRLSCGSKNLTDSRLSDILDAFVSSPEISLLSHLNLADNQLTRIPNQVKLLDRLYVIHLENNLIRTIRSGDFKSTRQGSSSQDRLNVYLSDNRINEIEPNAFQGGKYNIDLKRNQLTRFEASAFQSVLEGMVSNTGTIDISENISMFINLNSSSWFNFFNTKLDPIDCENDPCHLNWLIKNNRQLFNYVKSGYCNSSRRIQLEKLSTNQCQV